MESIVVRSAIIYIFVFLILRIGGKRTVGEMTTFDLVLLLIISEATQEALLDGDQSLIGGMMAIATLVFVDIVVSKVTARFRTVDKIVNSVPTVILRDGVPLQDRMDKERVSMEDILEAARSSQGLENLEQVKYAILEKDGSISIIPHHLNPEM
ncbi:MAG TPA: YetF domain-containing protein [Sphingobacteriaceae bacterium]